MYTLNFLASHASMVEVAEPGYEAITYSLITTATNAVSPLSAVISYQLLGKSQCLYYFRYALGLLCILLYNHTSIPIYYFIVSILSVIKWSRKHRRGYTSSQTRDGKVRMYFLSQLLGLHRYSLSFDTNFSSFLPPTLETACTPLSSFLIYLVCCHCPYYQDKRRKRGSLLPRAKDLHFGARMSLGQHLHFFPIQRLWLLSQ